MYYSAITASKEVKKYQLRAQFLLDSHKIRYEMIDISDPAMEEVKMMMQREAKKRTENQLPQPPQFFNDDEYCGVSLCNCSKFNILIDIFCLQDFEDMEEANDNDELLKFLKLEEDITIENGKGEDDLFIPSGQDDQPNEEKEKKEEEKFDESDENVELEVKEQCTINGVVYDIPPDRKINVGGRIIDVDELIANEAEEISLDDVDDELKTDFVAHKENGNDEEEEED